jgi:hypothetical protein
MKGNQRVAAVIAVYWRISLPEFNNYGIIYNIWYNYFEIIPLKIYSVI